MHTIIYFGLAFAYIDAAAIAIKRREFRTAARDLVVAALYASIALLVIDSGLQPSAILHLLDTPVSFFA
ncbi:hypothetical protein ACQR0V_11715 [Bradyrhizobium sp. HKCCYLS2058]|uniref:hypothetical protein n=1 Tax=unclassified Bradyrhizobium TaxID=2631580 RepID=UPI003EBD0944